MVGTLGDVHGEIGDDSRQYCIPNFPVVVSQEIEARKPRGEQGKLLLTVQHLISHTG